MRRITIVLILVLTVFIFFTPTGKSQSPPQGAGYNRIITVILDFIEKSEANRLAIINIAERQRKHLDDQLMWANNLLPGHVSLLLESGLREDRTLWTNATQADRDELQAIIIELEGMAPTQ
jgi:hypothetical protein